MAERIEQALDEERQNFLEEVPATLPEQLVPPCKPPFTVGLDGACVHAGGRAGWFEVIVGKCVSAAGDGKYFGFVHNINKSRSGAFLRCCVRKGWTLTSRSYS